MSATSGGATAVSVTSAVCVRCTSLVAGIGFAVGWTTSTVELGMSDDGILANTFWMPADTIVVKGLTHAVVADPMVMVDV